MAACTSSTNAQLVAGCEPRVAIVDVSASSRSDDRQRFVAELTTALAISSAICAQPVEVFMVSGPGAVAHVLSADDVAAETPTGPNPTIRASRFGDDAASRLQDLVIRRITDGYLSLAADTSSISAMLVVAADHATAETHVIMVTDGVNTDDLATLNRPLSPGEGAKLASQLPDVSIPARRITFVGIGIVDATAPAPSPIWEREVRAFVQAICAGSGAAECKVLGTSSVNGLFQ